MESQFLKSMLIKILSLIILAVLSQAAQKINPPELSKTQLSQESQIVKLANKEKFVIPKTGKTINVEIQYLPENSGQCFEIPQTISYQSIGSSPAIFEDEEQSIIVYPLKIREIVFVADSSYNIASFSIDEHFLMEPRIPKTLLSKSSTPSPKKNIRNPVIVATENEEYIFYLTHEKSFVFHYSNLASDIKQFTLAGSPAVVIKAIIVQSYLIVCAGTSGLLVYHIDFKDHSLTLFQTIIDEVNPLQNSVIDMEFNKEAQLLYVLSYVSSIKVYVFNPDQNIKLESRKALKLYDEISLQKIIYNHNQETKDLELISTMSLQISSNRAQQSIMVLFNHQAQTVIAELTYDQDKKKYYFVRYYKYSVQIKQMHIINEDVMMLVGEGTLGLFPYGVDPRLIDEQFNGFMTLSEVKEIHILEPPLFVGMNKNQIEYGGIYLQSQTGVTCHLNQDSQLKQIKIRANLTSCGDASSLRPDSYCQFTKTFILESMEITTSVGIASSIWIVTIVLTLLLVVGLCCLFGIHKKKQQEIRKLQLYFEERKRSSQVPASSDRQH